jgi:hypothetical protein
MSTATIRITKLQTGELVPAFRQIYVNHVNLQHTGHLRDCHPELPYSGLTHRFGHFNPVFMDMMIEQWKQIRHLQSTNGGRLYNLDAFGVAACIFAVRATLRMVRHGHHELLSERMERSAKQFITKLEAEHKWLKRALIDEVGLQKYNRAAREWRSFLKFLRYAHLYCRCSYRPRNNLYRLRRKVLDQFCRWTEEELTRRNKTVPKNLRELIRRHLAYGRRGRTKYIVVHARSERSFAAPYLADYVLSHTNQEN